MNSDKKTAYDFFKANVSIRLMVNQVFDPNVAFDIDDIIFDTFSEKFTDEQAKEKIKIFAKKHI